MEAVCNMATTRSDPSSAMRGRLRSRAGISLVELLVGVALTGILTAIAMPHISGFRASYDLTRAAQQMAFEVARGRMLAIGENNYVRVRIGAGTGSGYILATDFTLERSTDSGATYQAIGRTTSLPRSISMWAYPPSVTINRQGLSSSSLNLYLFNSQYQWKIVSVSSLGKVTIQ